MFNSKSYYTEEDAILANVEADLSYDGADGLCRAIMESYENERLVESLMDRADAEESRMLSESASEEDIQSLQEASVKSVVQYIIGIMQRFWAKLKGMVMRFIHKIQLWWTKRKIVKGLKADQKARAKMSDKGATYGDSKDTKTVFGIKDFGDLKSVLEKIHPDLTGCKVFLNFIDEEGSFTGAGEGSESKSAYSDEEFADEMVHYLFGSPKINYDSLKDDVEDVFFTEEDIPLTAANIGKAEELLKSAKDNITALKKFGKDGEKYCKKICSMANKAKMKDNHYYLKALNKAIRIANNVIFRSTNVIFALILRAMNSTYSFYKAGAVSSVTVTLK